MSEKKQRDYCHAVGLIGKKFIYVSPFNSPITMSLDTAEECFKEEFDFLYAYNTERNYIGKKTGTKCNGVFQIIYPYGLPSPNIKATDFKEMFLDGLKRNNRDIKKSLESIVKSLYKRCRESETLYNIGEGECHFSLTSTPDMEEHSRNIEETVFGVPHYHANEEQEEKKTKRSVIANLISIMHAIKEKKYKEKVGRFKEYQNKLEEKIDKCLYNPEIKMATKKDPEKAAYLFLAELKKKKLFNIYKDLLHLSNIEEVIEMFEDYKRELIKEGKRTKRGKKE